MRVDAVNPVIAGYLPRELYVTFLMMFPTTERGGAEEFALSMTAAAIDAGYTGYVAFPERPAMASLVADFQAIGAAYCPLEIPPVRPRYSRSSSTAQLLRTLALLCRLKPTLVHINLTWPIHCFGSIVACALLRIPTLVRFALVPPTIPFHDKTFRMPLYTWARRRRQCWICVSDDNLEIVAREFNIPPNKLVRIYNGTKFPNMPSECGRASIRNEVRSELGISADSVLLVTVGRLVEQKGYDTLAAIVPAICRDFPEVYFVWIGEGDMTDQLNMQIRAGCGPDNVIMLGHRNDVPRFLYASDLFIFPTRFEGHSRALTEAMAHGVPVIASDASSNPELIINDKNGLLFPTGDVDILLDKIHRALNQPDAMRELARQSRADICRWTETDMINAYCSIWTTLLQTDIVHTDQT